MVIRKCAHEMRHDKIVQRGKGVCKWCGADYAEVLFPGYVTEEMGGVCEEEREDDVDAMWDDVVKVVENHR